MLSAFYSVLGKREINSPKCTASLCGRGVKGSPRPRDRRWFQRGWHLKSKHKRLWLWPFASLGQTGRRAKIKEKIARWTTVINDFYTLLVMAVVYDPGKSSHPSHTRNGLLGRFWSLNKMGYVIVCNIGCCLASPWKELPCWWRWWLPALPPSGSPHLLATTKTILQNLPKKEQKRLENVHPSNHKLSKMFLPKCVGLCQNQHFLNRRRRILIY